MLKYLILSVLIYSSSSISLASNTFKVLTFNCWTVELPQHVNVKVIADYYGGKIKGKLENYEISQLIDERLRMLPTKVAETGADIVVLQEVWKESRKKDLISEFKKVGYPYAVYKYPKSEFEWQWSEFVPARGYLGNGLIIFSKYPLNPNVKVMKFTEHTRADELATYKGAIKTQVQLPDVGWVDLFDSHLGAYTTEPKSETDATPDHYNEIHLQKKLDQARELFDFILDNRKSENVILAMDMNTHYNTYINGQFTSDFAPEYSLMTCRGAERFGNCLSFDDTYRHVHGFTNPPAWTYDTVLNDYAKGGLFASEPQEVIDYIFVNRSSRIKPVKSEIVFNQRLTEEDRYRFDLPELPPFLSDHYGVLTTFEIH